MRERSLYFLSGGVSGGPPTPSALRGRRLLAARMKPCRGQVPCPKSRFADGPVSSVRTHARSKTRRRASRSARRSSSGASWCVGWMCFARRIPFSSPRRAVDELLLARSASRSIAQLRAADSAARNDPGGAAGLSVDAGGLCHESGAVDNRPQSAASRVKLLRIAPPRRFNPDANGHSGGEVEVVKVRGGAMTFEDETRAAKPEAANRVSGAATPDAGP